MEVVTFTVIVDDIIYSDGHSSMACLGGGGPQTAFGAKLWTRGDERVGLAAAVGSDFPSSCREWLKDMEIDSAGLVVWPNATLRAWQILEEDGRRSQVWRVAVGDEVLGMLRPSISVLPYDYQTAKAYHAGVHPSGRDIAFVRELRSTGAEIVSIETYTSAEDIVSRSELMALVSAANIFSPNEKEAVSLVGPGTPLEIIGRLVELGAEVVSLRRGHLGCIVHRSDTGETWEIPAFHTTFDRGSNRFPSKRFNSSRYTTNRYTLDVDHGDDAVGNQPDPAQAQIYDIGADVRGVIDPTGCGNSFCGGFLFGWLKTRNLLTAALWGSVSASFMVEYEGVPPPTVSYWQAQAEFRLKVLKPHARQIELKNTCRCKII